MHFNLWKIIYAFSTLISKISVVHDIWICSQLKILYDRVHHIVHLDLDMKKISAKWIAKCLNADQKRARVLFETDADFLSRLVTMDETWVYFYDPETKQESMKALWFSKI